MWLLRINPSTVRLKSSSETASLKVKTDNCVLAAEQTHSPFSQFVPGERIFKHIETPQKKKKECFCWLIKFLWRSTTQQLAALNKHDWLGVRKEIIYYQCLSGATPGLWKKPGCESGGEQCSQLLLTRQDKKEATTTARFFFFFHPPTIRWSSSYQACPSTEYIIIHFCQRCCCFIFN